ncbi:hypothetical protein J6590_016886 [Homalodisca vitripennis]|nr:hypothetical protein J6590_016886 [Homalodisca vitripennis]
MFGSVKLEVSLSRSPDSTSGYFRNHSQLGLTSSSGSFILQLEPSSTNRGQRMRRRHRYSSSTRERMSYSKSKVLLIREGRHLFSLLGRKVDVSARGSHLLYHILALPHLYQYDRACACANASSDAMRTFVLQTRGSRSPTMILRQLPELSGHRCLTDARSH